MSQETYTPEKILDKFFRFMKTNGMKSEDYNFFINMLAVWIITVRDRTEKELKALNKESIEVAKTLDKGYDKYIVGRN